MFLKKSLEIVRHTGDISKIDFHPLDFFLGNMQNNTGTSVSENSKENRSIQIMKNLIIPPDYASALNLHDTQIAIKTVKDFFQNLLSQRLNLSRDRKSTRLNSSHS